MMVVCYSQHSLFYYKTLLRKEKLLVFEQWNLKMVIGFLTDIIFFLVYTVLLWLIFPSENIRIIKKYKKHIGICINTMNVILLAVSIIDFTGIIHSKGYSGASLFILAYGIISTLLFQFRSKIADKYTLFFGFTTKLLSFCLFMEVFVFNFGSAHLLLGDYEQKNLDLTTAISENFDFSTNQNISSGNTSFEFRDINMPIGTVEFTAESSVNPSVKVSIDMSDDTYSARYRTGIASAEIINGNNRSKTAVCNFSGSVHNIKFNFTSSNGEYITISRITVNSPAPFTFSFIRFFTLFVSGMIIYFLVESPIFRKSLADNRKTVTGVSWTFTAILLAISLVIINGTRYANPNHSIAGDFKSTSGNQISQEIVDAFEAGTAVLNAEVPEGLLNLENPYDDSQRAEAQVSGELSGYMWDHLLYDGKYYSYYGIGPVLVLFLPYHVLTGYYFPSVWAVWIFSAGGIIFLTAFYLNFMKRFFDNIRSSLILSGLAIIQLVTGIYFCLPVTNFYEIAQASGFFFVTGGAYFLITSNVIGNGKISNQRICLSSIFLSFGVLCRPTLAVYCITALIFIGAGFVKNKKLLSENKKKSGNISYILYSMIPFVVIGLVQMIYNYIRFGSFFDFGIQYSLTINDFTNAEFHTKFTVIGFVSYLLKLPNFSAEFPFVITGWTDTFYPQGYYFVATGSALGLLWKALPILSYGYAFKAYRQSESKNKRMYAVLLSAVCIICPFAIIFSIWESGFGTRYCVDFAWQIVIGALIIAFVIYSKRSDETKNHLNKIMIASTFICAILAFAQTYGYINPIGSYSKEWTETIMSIQRLFEFWR